MKKLKKFCKNLECREEILNYKSAKREFCSDYCRGRYGYLNRLEENKEYIAQINGQKDNYKVLKLHKDAGIKEELLDKYVKLGFNSKYLTMKRFIHNSKKEYYVIKDIEFTFDDESKTIKIIN